MAQSTQVVQTKMLDYFFSLRKLHTIAFQPIVTLATGELYEYECLFRPADADAPAVDRVGGPGGDQHRPRCRARRLHRRHGARADRPARGDRTGRRQAAPPLRDQPDAVQPARPGVRGDRARPTQVRDAGLDAAPDHHRMHRAAVRPRHRPAPAPGQGPAPARFRVRGRRRGCRLRQLRAHRRPPPIGHQDRPRHRPRHRPRRRQAGPRRGVRLVRAPDRRAPPRRGHRTPRRPRRADRARRRARTGLPAREAGRRSRSRRGADQAGQAQGSGSDEAGRRRSAPPLAYHRGHDRPSPSPIGSAAFLDDERYATIATIDPDGTPRQAVIWYTLEGDEIVINSRGRPPLADATSCATRGSRSSVIDGSRWAIAGSG